MHSHIHDLYVTLLLDSFVCVFSLSLVVIMAADIGAQPTKRTFPGGPCGGSSVTLACTLEPLFRRHALQFLELRARGEAVVHVQQLVLRLAEGVHAAL